MSRAKKKVLVGYLVALHLLVVGLLARTDALARACRYVGLLGPLPEPEPTPYVAFTLKYQGWLDANTPDDSVLFVGDSITQSLCVSAVCDRAVNFGIAGDTTVGVLQRLPTYSSLPKARAVVVAVGTNDLCRRSNAEILDNYRRILASIPARVPVVWSAVMPVDERAAPDFQGYNRRACDLNAATRELCDSRPGCHFLDSSPGMADSSGNLSPDCHVGDGVHLSRRGYAVWVADLKEKKGAQLILSLRPPAEVPPAGAFPRTAPGPQ